MNEEIIFTKQDRQIQSNILRDVLTERMNQQKKWGYQNFPFTKPGIQPSMLPGVYLLPPEQSAKHMCNIQEITKSLTYGHLIVEELVEAIVAPTPEQQRQELIQLLAVILQCVESIDRNKQ